MSISETAPAARSRLFGALRRNPTMASLDFTTGIAFECPKCHYTHQHRKTTIHLSHRGNFRINPVECEQCGISMIKIGSCFLPFPFNSGRATGTNRSILSALATSAQVFGAVGSPAINVSQAAIRSDSVRAIRRHLMRTMTGLGLPEKFQHFILRPRTRQTSAVGLQNQLPLLDAPDNPGPTPVASAGPASQHLTPTSDLPAVSEFDFAHPLPFSARRRSAPPLGEIHRCDCNGSCHCPIPPFVPINCPRPYVAGDRTSNGAASSRSRASTPNPPAPNDLSYELLHLGFNHLNVPQHGSNINRLSQTNTEFSDGSSLGILEGRPLRPTDSNINQDNQTRGEAHSTDVIEGPEEIHDHYGNNEVHEINGYHSSNGPEESDRDLDNTNEDQEIHQNQGTQERQIIVRDPQVNGIEPYTNGTSSV